MQIFFSFFLHISEKSSTFACLIRSRTFDAFFPLIVTAAIYFLVAWLIGLLLNSLVEKRRTRAIIASVTLVVLGLLGSVPSMMEHAYEIIKEVLFTHMRDIRPLTLRMTHAELSGVTALDFMVENLDHSPLSDAARKSLRPQVKDLIEERTTRGFRVKLII